MVSFGDSSEVAVTMMEENDGSGAVGVVCHVQES